MTYEPINRLDPTRLPDVIENLTSEDVIVQRFEEGRINRPKIGKKQEHLAEVTTAMLYFGCGG